MGALDPTALARLAELTGGEDFVATLLTEFRRELRTLVIRHTDEEWARAQAMAAHLGVQNVRRTSSPRTGERSSRAGSYW
ncbi:MAG: hypothetical protein GEU96_05185 [Propionibacteriales bacterium]|nr:hypothetical protein [Propionibacteriales bacterium]